MENYKDLREKHKDLKKGDLPDGVGVRVHIRHRRDQVTPVVDIKCADALEEGDIFTNDNVDDLWAYMHYVADLETKKTGLQCEVSCTIPNGTRQGKAVPQLKIGWIRQGRHPFDNLYVNFAVPKGNSKSNGVVLDKAEEKSFEDFKKSFNKASK